MEKEYNKLKVEELKKELKIRGLDTKGTKQVLVLRLLESDDGKGGARSCDGGDGIIAGTNPGKIAGYGDDGSGDNKIEVNSKVKENKHSKHTKGKSGNDDHGRTKEDGLGKGATGAGTGPATAAADARHGKSAHESLGSKGFKGSKGGGGYGSGSGPGAALGKPAEKKLADLDDIDIEAPARDGEDPAAKKLSEQERKKMLLDEMEKRKKRAQRFDVPIVPLKEAEDLKKKMRQDKFGLTHLKKRKNAIPLESDTKQDQQQQQANQANKKQKGDKKISALSEEEKAKLESRKERFNTNMSLQQVRDLEEKRKQRLNRFSSDIDANRTTKI